MTNEAFLDEFGHLLEAPGGIARVRRLLLDLALTGRIVRLAAESRKLVALGDVAELENGDRGKNYPSKRTLVEFGVPFVNAGHLHGGQVDFDQVSFISEEHFRRLAGGRFQKGDVLFCLRGSLGKFAVINADAEGAIASSLVIVRPSSAVLAGYLAIYFDSGAARAEISEYTNGTAQPNMASRDLARFRLPLPSVEEQQQLIQRVEELMAFCDEIEERQAQAVERRAATARSALAELVELDRADTDRALRLVEEHVRLCLAPGEGAVEVLAQVRQAILDLAVRGRLVPHEFADGSGATEISGAGSGAVQSRRPWPQATLGDLCSPSQYGWTTSRAESGSIRLLRTTDISSGAIDWSSVPFCSDPPVDLDRYQLRGGDILISRAGSVGLSAVLADDPPCATAFASYLIRFRPKVGIVTPDYIRIFLQSSSYWRQIRASTSGTAMTNVNAKKLSAVEVPIPPMLDQNRIVARVDALMAVCDEVETALISERDMARQFAISACAGVVAGLDLPSR